MFRPLGDFLSKWWFGVLGIWVLLLIALRFGSPSFEDLTRAGEFLLIGALARMQQLGFALALGVLLDTLIIRPILVPAFLVLLQSPRYAPLTSFLNLPVR